jgi:subtilisin family serine protease
LHAAFDSLWLNGQILGSRDFVQPGNDVYSTSISSHGTRVLSTMGANLPGQLIGTAPQASYWLLRSEDTNGEYLLEEYFWVNAAEFADSVGVDIINSSLGYNFFDNPEENHSYEDMDGNTTIITIGADMAAAKGILVVNSAGNTGGNSAWPYITAPADGDSVFTIGAVDSDGNYVYFSSKGPTFDGRIKPDVMAQGSGTIVADLPSGIAAAGGTSFSSPIIAGASATLWQANPTLTNMDILNAIKATASKTTNPDNLMGWGIPDFLLANNLLTTTQIQTSNPIKDLKVFPNPFNEQINIEVELPQALNADIRLFNSQGQTVATLAGIDLALGKNRLVLNNLDKLPAGIYMLQVTDGYYSLTGKVIR